MRSSTPSWLLLGLSSLGFVTVGACARVAPQANAMTGGSGGSGGSSRPGIDAGVRPDRGPTNIPMQCGDGVRTQDEACDDGNAVAGDGCAADCRTVEPGFSCAPAGQRRVTAIARCGDGVVVPPELCDDGNTDRRRRLLGHVQDRARLQVHRQPQRVHAARPAATRSSRARRAATTATPCRSTAAPRTVRASPTAPARRLHVELRRRHRGRRGLRRRQQHRRRRLLGDLQDRARLHVHPAAAGRQDAGADRLSRLSREAHADGLRAGRARSDHGPRRHREADARRGTASRCSPGSPTASIASPATFAEWYRDTPSVNHTTAGKLTLWSNGKGAYVNRYGANGEPWPVTIPAYYCGNVVEPS